jgi:hypothetical protein
MNLADMLASQHIIETQEHNIRGEILEVVYDGFSPNTPNTINFRVRYRPLRTNTEAWTTYQIPLPEKGYVARP